MTPAQIYFIRLNKTPTVGRPVAVSHSYITWPISIFVAELLTIKIHMPSVLGNSTELIQFIKNTGLTSVQFLSCYRGFISFYPDVDIKKALVAPDILLRKNHVFVIPLQNQIARLVAVNDYSSSKFISGIYHQKYGMPGIAIGKGGNFLKQLWFYVDGRV